MSRPRNGDVNRNNLIDAYDISVVTAQLNGGTDNSKSDKVSGKLEISIAKRHYKKDEIIEGKVKGTDLKAVNAFKFCIALQSAGI